MKTLTIKHYRDSFNTNKVYLIKKSKHGHYFINQCVKGILTYNTFKRVSVKTVKDVIANAKLISNMAFKMSLALCVADALVSSVTPIKQYAESLEYYSVGAARRMYNLGYAFLEEFNQLGYYRDELRRLYKHVEAV